MKAVFKTSLIVVMYLALWPALATAQPPDPKGTPVYNDDFSDPAKSGLEDNIDAADFQRGFHAPGVYHLKLLENNDARWVVLPNQSYGTFTLEMDLWDNSDEFTGDVALGAVFRAKDQAHLYAVLIDPRKGQYAVRKLDGQDQWSDLVAWKASPLIKQQAEVNHLRVDGEGDQFTIYLNDEQLDSFSDAAYDRGGVGMIAMNIDANEPHMHFDNLEITSTDTSATPMPGVIPNTGLTNALTTAILLCIAGSLMVLGGIINLCTHDQY